MKRNIFVCLLLLAVLFLIISNQSILKADTIADSFELKCVSRYTFRNENLGKDEQGNFNLNMVGNVTKTDDGASFDGKSALFFKPKNGMDVTDMLDCFTITCWAKENSIGRAHRFMVGSGCAYSESGFGMGFYQTNSAYIVPNGTQSGYADNFVTSQGDSFGTKVDNYKSSTEWNLYTLMVTNGESYYGVNGHLYKLSKDININTIKNYSQTFTIGGVYSNDGTKGYNLFNGEIADVRVYNDFLNETEFASLYNDGRNGTMKVIRDNKIEEITDNMSDSEYDYEINTDNFNQDTINTKLLQLKPKVKLSNGEIVDGCIIFTSINIDGNKGTAEGVISVKGVSSDFLKKVTINITKGDCPIYLNTTFTDHMILQRNKKVKVFGYGGKEGNKVVVKFNGQEKETSVTSDGWSIYLDEMQALNEGKTLEVVYNEQTITIEDVLVGEVLLCSGQSNMNISINYINNKDSKVKNQYLQYDNYDKIRVLDIPYSAANEPTIYQTPRSTWTVNSSINDVMNYSAYAMTVASHYQAILGDVPVGVITASVGGSCIEEWIDPDSMKNLNSFASAMNKVDSQYYNSFIYNLGGYSIGEIIWYQGEANSQPSMVRDYIKQFNAYVKKYRELFEDENLPIIVQQLVQFDNWVQTGNIRQAQWDFMKNISNVYTVCGIDTGSMEKSDGIHATDKWILGARVTGILAMIQGIKQEDFKVSNPYGVSPTITKAEMKKTNNGYEITLSTNDNSILSASGSITGFEVKIGYNWKNAEASVVNGKVIVKTNLDNVTAIRYNFLNGYENNDGVFVYNSMNLPLAPIESINVTIIAAQEEDDKTSSSSSTIIPSMTESSITESNSQSSIAESSGNTQTKKGCGGNLSSFAFIPMLFVLGLIVYFRQKRY